MNAFPKIIIYLLTITLTSPVFAQTAFEAVLGDTKKYADVTVRKVQTVDTFELDTGEKIRLIGIKGPELPRKVRIEQETQGDMGFVMQRPDERANPVEPIEQQAYDFVKDLLEGQRVRIELDSEKKSDDHRTFAYVYLWEDDTFVNAEILRQGFAYLAIRPPNTKHDDILRDAYRESREERRGLQSQ